MLRYFVKWLIHVPDLNKWGYAVDTGSIYIIELKYWGQRNSVPPARYKPKSSACLSGKQVIGTPYWYYDLLLPTKASGADHST